MCNSTFSYVIVNDTIPLVYQLFAASVCGCGNGGFTLAPADYFYTAMINCDSKASFLATKKATLRLLWIVVLSFYLFDNMNL